MSQVYYNHPGPYTITPYTITIPAGGSTVVGTSGGYTTPSAIDSRHYFNDINTIWSPLGNPRRLVTNSERIRLFFRVELNKYSYKVGRTSLRIRINNYDNGTLLPLAKELSRYNDFFCSIFRSKDQYSIIPLNDNCYIRMVWNIPERYFNSSTQSIPDIEAQVKCVVVNADSLGDTWTVRNALYNISLVQESLLASIRECDTRAFAVKINDKLRVFTGGPNQKYLKDFYSRNKDYVNDPI